tara:strand:- start:110 stop:1315 length:1206 start_codon:yes stop_codon:yes gene_type:complete
MASNYQSHQKKSLWNLPLDFVDAIINIGAKTTNAAVGNVFTGGEAKDVPVKEFVYDAQETIQGILEKNREALDIAGFSPGLGGMGADLLNSLISFSEGEFGQAGLYAASMIPFVDLATKPKALVKLYKKYGDKIGDALKKTDSYISTGGKTVSDADVAKVLKKLKPPKTLANDITKDIANQNVKFVDDLIENVNKVDDRYFKRTRDFLSKEGKTKIPGLGRGLKRYEKGLLADQLMKAVNPYQGYFSERGLSGQTTGNAFFDILYSALPTSYFETTIPLGVEGAKYGINKFGQLGGFPEGEWKNPLTIWDAEGYEKGDDENKKIDEGDITLTDKNSDSVKGDAQEKEVKLSLVEKQAYRSIVVDYLMDTTKTDSDWNNLLKSQDEDGQKYLKETYPKHFKE